jgi:hypothetical protein
MLWALERKINCDRKDDTMDRGVYFDLGSGHQ